MESVAVYFSRHRILMEKEPLVGRGATLTMVLRHLVVLLTESTSASVDCSSPGMAAAFQSRFAEPTVGEITARQVQLHQVVLDTDTSRLYHLHSEAEPGSLLSDNTLDLLRQLSSRG